MVTDVERIRLNALPEDIRQVVDVLADALVVVDADGRFRYVNPAAAELFGRSATELGGRSVGELLPPEYSEWLPQFRRLIAGQTPELLGKQLHASLLTADGAQVPVELVISVAVSGSGEPVAIGVLRLRQQPELKRLTRVTEQLLEVLGATSGAAPVDQLLQSLCRRLHWDVAALWGMEQDGSVICRGVWTVPEAPAAAYVAEKELDLRNDIGGLARQVIDGEQSVWFTDLGTYGRFHTPAIVADGLVTACAFPVRYRGQCLGAVKMLSRTRRPPEPELIELIGAISGPVGGILHALEQAAERGALVAELESTQQRLQFLLRANKVVSEAGDYDQTLERLAEVAVPTLGDLCLIDVLDEVGTIRRVASRHADPRRQSLADQLLRSYAPTSGGHHPSAAVMSTGRSRWSPDMSDEFLHETVRDERHFAIAKQLGFTSYMTVPLLVEKRVRGTVTLVSAGSGRRYSEHELAGAEELASQIAGVVERARLSDRERKVSQTLQHSLLPERFPQVDGLSFAARYLPAGEEVEVGGDWYEVLRAGTSTASLMIGDVQGHDMEAASVVGRVRHGLALLLAEGAPPALALRRMNEFLLSSDVRQIATVLVAQLDAASGELWLCSAGHPPPLLVGGSRTGRLGLAPNPPLGVRGATFREDVVNLADETLLLFSDGLFERRGRHPDDGIDRVLDAARALATADLAALVDGVVSRLVADGGAGDDVTVLAAHRSGAPGPQPVAGR